jgi:ribonucrease Y
MDIFLLIAVPLSFLAGSLCTYLIHRFRIGKFETLASQIIYQGEKRAEGICHQAELSLKEKQIAQTKELEYKWQIEKRKLAKEEERLEQKEDKMEGRMQLVEKKLSDIEKREALLIARKTQVDEERKKIEEKLGELTLILEKASGLSAQEAKQVLLDRIEEQVRMETGRFIRRSYEEAENQAEMQAARIISIAINRLASSTVSELTTSTVALPSDEMKGRIIGREGRNIRSLEKATGVNFVMDDTPGAVVISSFDPIRRHIAKLALTDLLADGRIHPTRIEEAVEKSEKTCQKQIKQFGEDAAFRIGAMNIHPDLITLLGKLKFRYSLGQNVLDHSLEVAHLMGLMAGEFGLDVALAKRIGLLHDVGKAVSHEVEGTHAVIGHDLALRFGETKEVANGIGCHHFEMDPITVEASLCSSADAISASRPGGRNEAVEEYVKRLKKLEDLALEFPGVEKAFALQAGRELRVIALPDQLQDEDLTHLARNLTKRIEKELQYPGKIKVTILREKRVVDYAM